MKAYFDGATQPINPGGHCGWGYVVLNWAGDRLAEGSGYIPAGPDTSNNVAEYTAALECLRAVIQLRPPTRQVMIFGDPKLVIQQITGRWRVRGGLYVPSYRKLRALVDQTDGLEIDWRWIPRDENSEADELAHDELRRRGIPIVLGKAAGDG